MNPVSLSDDLHALAAQNLALAPLAQRIRAAGAPFDARAPLLGELAAQASLDPYCALALLLKALWEAEGAQNGPWSPWENTARLHGPLGGSGTELDPPALELLVIEQCVLSCHLVACAEAAALARRHAVEVQMLAAAPAARRTAYLADKRTWLLDEHRYDWLVTLRQQLVDELEATRFRYLAALGKSLVDYVEAAHRLALMRYRKALDPTLTVDEAAALLQHDLALAENDSGAIVRFDADLRRALFDTARGVQGDLDSMARLATLLEDHDVRTMTRDEVRRAALLFRRLARLIHPDALAQHPHYADITPANRGRLATIWHDASATHGTRTFLSHDRLVNYVQHLEAWIAEVQRILRNPAFHAPSRLLAGDTLDDRHADLRGAMADVQRHLHAVRDDIAQLEFDPQHDEYRRVIAMDERALAAERDRMAACVDEWKREAGRLAEELVARYALQARRAPGGSRTCPED